MAIVFEGLEDFSRRKSKSTSRKRAPKPKPKPSPLTCLEAMKIRALYKLSWPMDEAKRELEFHEFNLMYCKQLDKRLRHLRDKLYKQSGRHFAKAKSASKESSKKAHLRMAKKPYKQAQILQHIIHTLPAPIHIAIWWAEEVNRMAHNWQGWRGKLLDFTLNDYNESLDKRFFSLTYACCMDGSEWPPIRKKLRATKLEE